MTTQEVLCKLNIRDTQLPYYIKNGAVIHHGYNDYEIKGMIYEPPRGLTLNEVIDKLGITKQRISILVQDGRIIRLSRNRFDISGYAKRRGGRPQK